MGGGVDTGKTTLNQCFVVDSPQDLLYCDEVNPWSGQSQSKLFGSAPLPADFLVSFAYQNLSGDDFDANLLYSSAQLQAEPNGLSRGTAGGGSISVPLVAPNSLRVDRITRLDFRVSKVINYNRFRFQINFDAYNLVNISSVRSINSSFGSRWGFPNTIIDPRLLQFGGQIDF